MRFYFLGVLSSIAVGGGVASISESMHSLTGGPSGRMHARTHTVLTGDKSVSKGAPFGGVAFILVRA